MAYKYKGMPKVMFKGKVTANAFFVNIVGRYTFFHGL